MLDANQPDAMKWIKDQLIDDFNMKDLGKAEVIIKWEITQGFRQKH